MFRIEEESSICYRCTPLLHCPPSSRPYKMTIIDEKGAIVATSERPCKCSCLCICRPEVTVRDNTGTEIGKVINPCPPFLCCSMGVTVYNEQELPEYDISTCICKFRISSKKHKFWDLFAFYS